MLTLLCCLKETGVFALHILWFCGSHCWFGVTLLFFSCCNHYKWIKDSATHLCSRILVGPSYQFIDGHILGHGHVAELERKYLMSGWSIWKRHVDDSVKAAWTHQSLWDGKKRQSASGFPSYFTNCHTLVYQVKLHNNTEHQWNLIWLE